jgi:hypothetical protein
MTSVFVDITPERREQILKRIRQVQARVLKGAVDAGLLTEAQAKDIAVAEVHRSQSADLPRPEVKLQ